MVFYMNISSISVIVAILGMFGSYALASFSSGRRIGNMESDIRNIKHDLESIKELFTLTLRQPPDDRKE